MNINIKPRNVINRMNQLKEGMFFRPIDSQIAYLLLQWIKKYEQTSNDQCSDVREAILLNLNTLKLEDVNYHNELWDKFIIRLDLANDIEFVEVI